MFAQGLSRYMAVCLLSGYAWLAVAGAAWAATALGLPWRDAALHALGLGFIFSMIMGHAPVILPAIARVKLQFGFFFYVPLAALHLSLALRLAWGALDPSQRAAGASYNAVAIALFAATVVGAAVAWRLQHGAEGAGESTLMPGFMQLEEPPQPAPGSAFALWQLGFRPFYLLASAFAALSIGLWALQFSGWLGRPYLQGPIWHAHEMIFGFALAVVVGFLFTAGRNWTNQPTPTGAPLAALAALWVAGRILVLTPFGWAAAVVNAAFPLAAAIALAIPFFAAGNRRNYFFVGLLALMSLASLAVHLDQLGVLRFPGWRRHPGGAGHRALHHRGDGRPGDPDVHQQRRAGRGRDAPAAGWRRPRWARCWCCSPPTCCKPAAPCWRCSRRSARSRTWRAGRCGGRGRRCARRSSGCCMPPTSGFPSTSPCAPWRHWAGWPRPWPPMR